MKKLITLTCAVALVGITNAASVQWNSGTFSAGFKGPDGQSLANSTAYTMTVSFYSDANGSDLITSTSQTKAKANGAYNTSTADLFSANTTYYVSAIISANDGSASLKAALSSFTMGGTGDLSINFTTGANFDSASQKWASGGWESQSVPEPTSAILLMFGLCGLALKRKQK